MEPEQWEEFENFLQIEEEMESEQWEECASFLQIEEWNNTADRNSISQDLPHFGAIVPDRLGKQVLELDKSLSDGTKLQPGKPLRAEQLLEDEELAWALELSLQTVLKLDEGANRNSESHSLPEFQAVAADRWGKQVLELDKSLSEETKLQPGKPLRAEQVPEDEELAWALELSLQTVLKLDEGADRNSESHSLPELQAAAADRWGKQVHELDNDLSERQSQKPLREQLLVNDEDLARVIATMEQSLQSLHAALKLDEAADRNLKSESQVVAADLCRREQEQILQDEELAWRLEPGVYSENEVYNLFFAESTDDRGHVGVGCVIKDSDGAVVFENRVCIGVDISHYFAEYNALINGLDVAQSIGLTQINAHGNRAFIHWEVEGQVEAPSKAGRQLDALRKRIEELDHFSVNFVSRTENEDAIKLANCAAEHAPRMERKSGLEETRQQCIICFEKTFPSDIVCQEECCHRFCFDCLSQHVETEISAGKVPVRCPQISECARYMHDNVCKRLVSPQVFDTYSTRLTEATISDLEKVYCPFRGCSAMMCWTDENQSNIYAASSSTSIPGRKTIGSAECMECHRLFCVECHVPWHADLTCQQYQDLPPDERDAEDRKLFQLANDQKWKKCGKCRSLIILSEGCFHMTCRCGNEFCYTCGTNYNGREKMCQCPLFPEHIMQARRQ